MGRNAAPFWVSLFASAVRVLGILHRLSTPIVLVVRSWLRLPTAFLQGRQLNSLARQTNKQDFKREAAAFRDEVTAGVKRMEDAYPADQDLSQAECLQILIGYSFDFEAAHEKEENLYTNVITAVAEGKLSRGEAQEAAVELKKVSELDYTRCYT